MVFKSAFIETRTGTGTKSASIVLPDPRTPCTPAAPQQKAVPVDDSPHVFHRGVTVANNKSPTTAVGTVLSADLFAASAAPVPSRPSCGDPQQYARPSTATAHELMPPAMAVRN